MVTFQHCVLQNRSLLGCRLLPRGSDASFEGKEGSSSRISGEWRVAEGRGFHCWIPRLSIFTHTGLVLGHHRRGVSVD